MSITLYVKSNKTEYRVIPLVKSAIDSEITKLELASRKDRSIQEVYNL